MPVKCRIYRNDKPQPNCNQLIYIAFDALKRGQVALWELFAVLTVLTKYYDDIRVIKPKAGVLSLGAVNGGGGKDAPAPVAVEAKKDPHAKFGLGKVRVRVRVRVSLDSTSACIGS